MGMGRIGKPVRGWDPKAQEAAEAVFPAIHTCWPTSSCLQFAPSRLHSRQEDAMINICPGCGQYRDDKVVDVEQQRGTCPECSCAYPFRIMPLFIICGHSGVGKTTVMLELLSRSFL